MSNVWDFAAYVFLYDFYCFRYNISLYLPFLSFHILTLERINITHTQHFPLLLINSNVNLQLCVRHWCEREQCWLYWENILIYSFWIFLIIFFMYIMTCYSKSYPQNFCAVVCDCFTWLNRFEAPLFQRFAALKLQKDRWVSVCVFVWVSEMRTFWTSLCQHYDLKT